jgi:hypothetical protein
MVLETTYKNKEHTEKIKDIVGKPFSFNNLLFLKFTNLP